jgi:hypothetical protein
MCCIIANILFPEQTITQVHNTAFKNGVIQVFESNFDMLSAAPIIALLLTSIGVFFYRGSTVLEGPWPPHV